MILTLNDVADYVATLNVADREHIYCGKMQGKKQHCIGVYHLGRGQKRETIGGDENSSYRTKQISFLIHWDKSSDSAEKAAEALFEAIKKTKDVTVNGKRILFTRMLTDNFVDVGMDDDLIYEMVVEAEFYYER